MHQFTTYRRPDWPADRKAIPLLRWHHITCLVDAILHHNSNNGFTGVNFIGESGTGKSTMMTTIAHRIHQQKQFAVHWFSDYDMTRLVSILRLDPLLFFKPAHPAFQARFRQTACSASHSNLWFTSPHTMSLMRSYVFSGFRYLSPMIRHVLTLRIACST